jgi:predicted MFS family arabinose efflux permease
LTGRAALPATDLARTRWALMGGNFAIGCGVLAATGAMNNLVSSLSVSVSLGGQLVTIGAVIMALTAPAMAAAMAAIDRRRLLAFWLLWFGVGHLLQAQQSWASALAAVGRRRTTAAKKQAAACGRLRPSRRPLPALSRP